MKQTSILFFISAILFVSCEPRNQVRLIENSGYAQGSTYQIKYLVNKNKNYAKELEEILFDIDNSMSTYQESSLISAVNKGGTWVEIDSMFIEVMQRSIEIAKETDGDFDPTVGPLVRIWGFGYDKVNEDVSSENIMQVKSFTGFTNIDLNGNKLRIPKGFTLDFNAIAQGYTVDVLARYLEAQGVTDYMVEVGGEVRAKGKNDKGAIWTIGVDKPQSEIDREERFQFILELENAGLATSGNYRKYWVDQTTGIKYSHTINPHTGSPALNRLLSASIVAPTTMDADAYATVCMVKGLENCKVFLAKKADLEGYLVYTNQDGDWEVYFTDGFKKYLKEEFRQQMD